jgi:hypothetical protein
MLGPNNSPPTCVSPLPFRVTTLAGVVATDPIASLQRMVNTSQLGTNPNLDEIAVGTLDDYRDRFAV